MIKINSIGNEDEMHYYKFDVSQEIHTKLINFFNTLKFPSEELIKIDIIFSELDNTWLYIKKKNMKVHFFIANKEITMVIDTDKSHEELLNLMKNNFTFPF